MNTYDVWYRTAEDGRAPELVVLDDDSYQFAGTMMASNLKDLQRKIDTGDPAESDLYEHRSLRVGDVVKEGSGGQFYVFTPLGLWATVQAFSDSPG
jgi:hypothetical protein